MSSAHNLAPAAAAGFKDASAYDEHRPGYPAEAVQKLLEHMRLADRPHARIVEVAAGTGKFTEALAARHEGFEVRAIEPHPDMRHELEAKALRGVIVADGSAQDMTGAIPEAEGGWGDGCVAAQAFHW
jgi:phospholipid N-methyltransferase